MRHVLTSVIGGREPVQPEVLALEVRPGDIFVLASDGLHNVVDEATIGRAVGGGVAPEAAARALVDTAIERGTTDNVTVVVVHV